MTRDLTRRTASASYKRSHELRATKAGAALVNRATQSLEAGEAAAQAHLSPGERSILGDLLHKLARSAAR